jgi:hypothetical protein
MRKERWYNEAFACIKRLLRWYNEVMIGAPLLFPSMSIIEPQSVSMIFFC